MIFPHRNCAYVAYNYFRMQHERWQRFTKRAFHISCVIACATLIVTSFYMIVLMLTVMLVAIGCQQVTLQVHKKYIRALNDCRRMRSG